MKAVFMSASKTLLFALLLGCPCLIAVTQPVRAQTATNQNVTGAEVLARAKKLHSQDGPSKALPEYEKALTLFRHAKDRKNEAITIGLMGNCFKRLGQHAKALELLQTSLAMKRELGDRLEEGKTLSNLGLFYWETSDYTKAIDYYTQAMKVANELGDKKLEAAIHNNLGLVYDETGDARALDEYSRAMELYRGTEPSGAMADTIGNLGGWNLLHGRYTDALKAYQEALAIDEKLELKPSVALDLQNIGLSYVGLGRGADAVATLDRAISIAHDTGLIKEEADSRKAKASALLQLGKYTEAIDQYNKAAEVFQQAGLNGEAQYKQSWVEVLGDLGTLEVRLGDLASAEKQFRRAIDVAEQIKHPRGVTMNLLSLGDLQARQKRYAEAAALYEHALSRAVTADDKRTAALARVQLAHVYRNLRKVSEAESEARQANDIAKNTQAKPLEAEALFALAEVFRVSDRWNEAVDTFRSGSAVARDVADPELSWRFDFGLGQTLEALARNDDALVCYQNAVKTIEAVRTALREQRFRAGYIEDKYQVYLALVQLLIKLGRVEDAFVAAEKLRARTYLDMLDRGQPPLLNESQRQTEQTLKSRIRDLQQHLDEENSKPNPERRRKRLDQFSSELKEVENEYQRFLDDISAAEPSYAAARALKVPTSNDVRGALTSATALLEYVVAEDQVVVFVITSDGLHAKTISASNDDIASKTETLRDLTMRRHTDEWKAPAAALFRTLIQPIRDAGWLKGKQRLYIVPHTILHYVPFSVLRDDDRLLVDDYVIAYLPAAAALTRNDANRENGKSILAMSPANTRLRYTRAESETVSSFFPNNRTVLVGPRATETSFKELAKRFDVIHLATHAYFNKANPLLSGLVLEADAAEDGRLEVHEIMNLRLNANLVTLSACDTAVATGYFSDVPPGDDLVGLTRAFLSTGTSTVLASLWEINDRSAVSFMNKFYRELRRADKASALTQAQRQTRLRPAYRHPYYWAAFVLAGRMN